MADLSSTFNELLKGHDAPPTKPFTTDTADEFLKEAYRIVSHPIHLRRLRRTVLTYTPRPLLSPNYTPSFAISVKPTSRLLLRARRTFTPPLETALLNQSTLPIVTAKRLMPMPKRRCATSMPAFELSRTPNNCARAPRPP